MASVQLTPEQTTQLVRLKMYFPYRIVFGVLKSDGTFEAWAKSTRQAANRLARQGHTVFILA